MSTSLMSVARLLPPRLWSGCQPSKSLSVALGYNVYRHSCSLPWSFSVTNRNVFQSSFCTEAKPSSSNKTDKEDKDTEKSKEQLKSKGEGKDGKVESKQDLLEKEVASLKEKLKLKDKELTTARTDVLRTLADMENLRSRSQRDNKQVRNFAIQSFAKSLLDVADNLQLAVKNAKQDVETETDNKSLKVLFEGIGLTEKTLAKAFKKHNISQFESLDTVFDPNKHEGVFQFPDPTRTPGTVGNVLKEGYMIRDRVLRPAQVGTVMAPPQETKQKSPDENTTDENTTDESTTKTSSKKNSV